MAAGLFGPSGGMDASGIGVSEPGVMPGAVGDVDSLLMQLQNGQFSAEALLPLLLMLSQMGGGVPGGAPAGPMPEAPMPQGDPIEQAFLAGGPSAGGLEGLGSPAPGAPSDIPPELLALLGG